MVTPRTMKENNGKAARKATIRQISAWIGFCCFLVVVMELVQKKNKKKAPSSQDASLTQQQQQQQLLLRNRHPPIPTDSYSSSNKHDRHGQPNRREFEKDIELILSASVHLIDIQGFLKMEHSSRGDGGGVTYDGITGIFCQVDWSKHKKDPSSYPMFRDLVQASPYCRESHKIMVNFREMVEWAKAHDADQQRQTEKENEEEEDDDDAGNTLLGLNIKDRTLERRKDGVYSMIPKGFVFHESRCGSTLAANALASMDPSSTRVYSESSPPINALKIATTAKGLTSTFVHQGFKEEEEDLGVALFRDVIYMMGRTNDPNEQNLFFKIQSIGTKSIHVFLQAFPQTPWIFVYRDPVQVMMSHLEQGPRHANCVRQLSDVPSSKLEFLQSHGKIDLHSLRPEEKCALHLSMLCESALEGIQSSPNTGKAVNYIHFIEKFMDKVLPEHFHIPLDDTMRQRILAVSKMYSKGRGDRAKEFKEDSQQKDKAASETVRSAAQLFLTPSYEQLESYAISIE